MAQQAVRAGVRAVKSSRKFVPRKAAVVMVSRNTIEKLMFNMMAFFYAISCQTQAAANQVVRILKESTDAVSVIYIPLGVCWEHL